MFKAVAVIAVSIALFGCASVPMGDAARDATLKTFQAPAGKAGFIGRWRHTPYVTISLYACLATLCFIETLDFGAFGGGPERFFIMAVEYIVYIALSAYLLRSRRIAQRFGASE